MISHNNWELPLTITPHWVARGYEESKGNINNQGLTDWGRKQFGLKKINETVTVEIPKPVLSLEILIKSLRCLRT